MRCGGLTAGGAGHDDHHDDDDGDGGDDDDDEDETTTRTINYISTISESPPVSHRQRLLQCLWRIACEHWERAYIFFGFIPQHRIRNINGDMVPMIQEQIRHIIQSRPFIV